MEDGFLTELELAKRIHVSLGTLRRWRLENRGPKFRKLGALVRYGEYDLSQWMQAQPCGGDAGMERVPPRGTSRGDLRLRRTA